MNPITSAFPGWLHRGKRANKKQNIFPEDRRFSGACSGKLQCKNILLTGLPGCGKTTLLKKVLEELPPEISRSGFFTGEIREDGVRVGFEINSLDGRRGVLSHVRWRTGYRVGRYEVDVKGFEDMVLPLIDAGKPRLIVVDEIGKMECFSVKFCRIVKDLLTSGPPLIGSVALKGGGFIGEIRVRRDVEIVQVTPGNRDDLVSVLVKRIIKMVR